MYSEKKDRQYCKRCGLTYFGGPNCPDCNPNKDETPDYSAEQAQTVEAKLCPVCGSSECPADKLRKPVTKQQLIDELSLNLYVVKYQLKVALENIQLADGKTTATKQQSIDYLSLNLGVIKYQLDVVKYELKVALDHIDFAEKYLTSAK